MGIKDGKTGDTSHQKDLELLEELKKSGMKYGEIIDIIRNTDVFVENSVTPSYYGEKCVCGRKIDWYTISDLYRKNKGAAWDHAGKKLLRAGEGHKSLIKDINEVIDSLTRWKEQIGEKDDK